MTITEFANACNLISLAEVEKACYLAFFYLKTKDIEDFTVNDAARWLVSSGGAKPNQSRLETSLRSSRNTIRASRGWKLTVAFVKELEAKYPTVASKSQEVIDEGTILPEVDYQNTRGYIVSLAKQMNACYENNIFDGCAVLLRRLLEVLLILSYRKLQIENVIQDANNNYIMLEGIVSNAKANTTLNLSRNSKGSLDTFRELGNFSAHKIEYTCRREYIQPEIQKYRALIVELLHKSGLRI